MIELHDEYDTNSARYAYMPQGLCVCCTFCLCQTASHTKQSYVYVFLYRVACYPGCTQPAQPEIRNIIEMMLTCNKARYFHAKKGEAMHDGKKNATCMHLKCIHVCVMHILNLSKGFLCSSKELFCNLVLIKSIYTQSHAYFKPLLLNFFS